MQVSRLLIIKPIAIHSLPNFVPNADCCEKGAGKKRGAKKNEAPNLFAFKNKLLFDRESLPADEAPRGTVGIAGVTPTMRGFFRASSKRVCPNTS